jgi:UPF0716 protein FxsA
MVKWIVIAILLLPLAEIAAFILVAALVGFAWALLLTLASTLAGALVLRQAGRGQIARLHAAVAETGAAGIAGSAGGLLIVLAGLLLFLPGFLTDLIGAALLIAPVRRWCGRTLRGWLRRRRPGESDTIELAPGEWRQVPDSKLPDRSRDRD